MLGLAVLVKVYLHKLGIIKSKKHLVFSMFLILFSQILSEGRMGLLVSTVIIWYWLIGSSRGKVYLVLIPLLVILVVPDETNFFSTKILRLNNENHSNAEDLLNDVSANRIIGYIGAFDVIAKHPLAGIGFEKLRFKLNADYGYNYDVHNVWLSHAASSGILSALLLFITIIKLLPVEKKLRMTLLLIMILGTFSEPNFLIGTFQVGIPFWLLTKCV